MSRSVAPRVVEVAPSRGLVALRPAELWEYRDLLRALVARDVKVRYKQTIFGVAWALLQPLAMMVVLSVFLGNLVRMPSEGVPYPVFVYSGLICWLYFADALRRAGESLMLNSALVSKVYFPRLIAPLAGVCSPLIDFVIAFAMLLVLLIWYGIPLTWATLLAPLIVLPLALTAAAFGVWLAALNAEYRDVAVALPVLIQLWLFLSPVIYPVGLVPESYRVLYGMNPIVGIINSFRWAVLGRGEAQFGLLAMSTAVVLLVLLGGLLYFRKVERRFADWI